MGIGIAEIMMLSVLYTPIWLIAFIDVLRNEFTDNNKMIWVLVIILVPVIGPIAYFFIGRKQKKKPFGSS